MFNTSVKLGRLIVIGSLLIGNALPEVAHSAQDSGWYVEAGVSRTDISGDLSGFFFDSRETGWSLGLGHRFNRYLSIQGSYHDVGNAVAASDCPPDFLCIVQNLDRVDIDGVSVAALGYWPVTDLVDVFGKLGIMRWDARFERFARDRSGEDLLYGIGVAINPSSKWRVSLQYEALDFDVDSTSLTVAHRFR